jgi:hypothetical protein
MGDSVIEGDMLTERIGDALMLADTVIVRLTSSDGDIVGVIGALREADSGGLGVIDADGVRESRGDDEEENDSDGDPLSEGDTDAVGQIELVGGGTTVTVADIEPDEEAELEDSPLEEREKPMDRVADGEPESEADTSGDEDEQLDTEADGDVRGERLDETDIEGDCDSIGDLEGDAVLKGDDVELEDAETVCVGAGLRDDDEVIEIVRDTSGDAELVELIDVDREFAGDTEVEIEARGDLDPLPEGDKLRVEKPERVGDTDTDCVTEILGDALELTDTVEVLEATGEDVEDTVTRIDGELDADPVYDGETDEDADAHRVAVDDTDENRERLGVNVTLEHPVEVVDIDCVADVVDVAHMVADTDGDDV